VSTTKQKTAARRNLKKARQAPRRPKGGGRGLSTADKKALASSEFAFPDERKEPLPDAGHVRNAIARFDQVEGVTDAERDRAWRRIRKASRKFGVEISEKDWRELFAGGEAKRRSG
jgi:hypothetical protein